MNLSKPGTAARESVFERHGAVPAASGCEGVLSGWDNFVSLPLVTPLKQSFG